MTVKPPFSWWGSKIRLAPWIVSHMPPHKYYVEVFGGSGAVLLAKEPSKLETFNDIDSGIIHFYRTLRDSPQELQLALALTPWSREEYERHCRDWRDADGVEKARRWYVVAMQSFDNGWAMGWRYQRKMPPDHVGAWLNAIHERLPLVHQRLSHVRIESLEWIECLRRYDGPDTLFYCDPPYLGHTRVVRDAYKHEFEDADHVALLTKLLELRGMFMVSGYPSDLYDQMLLPTCDVYERPRRQYRGQPERLPEKLWVSRRE